MLCCVLQHVKFQGWLQTFPWETLCCACLQGYAADLLMHATSSCLLPRHDLCVPLCHCETRRVLLLLLLLTPIVYQSTRPIPPPSPPSHWFKSVPSYSSIGCECVFLLQVELGC